VALMYIDSLLNKKLLIFIITIFSILFLATLYHRFPHVDDAILGEQVYFLLNSGHVRSDLLAPIPNYDKHIFVYHKLFILNGALITGVFGWSVYSLKSLSLIFLVIFLITIGRTYTLKNDNLGLLLFLVLFLANPNVIQYGFVYRPEIMLMTLGFLSYLSLERYFNSDNRFWLVTSALLAGLCVLTHLNGLTVIMAGFILLLASKRVSSSFLFAIIAASVSACYFLDIFYDGSFSGFLTEFRDNPALDESDFSLLSPIYKLLDEHKRFFGGWKEVIFSSIIILTLAFTLKTLVKTHQKTIYFATTLIVSLGLISNGNTSKYMLIYLPYLLMLTVAGLKIILLEQDFSTYYKAAIGILLSGYLFTGIYQSAKHISSNQDIASANDNIISLFTADTGSKIIAPFYFIFDEIQEHTIFGTGYYSSSYERYNEHVLTSQRFFEEALSKNVKYIVMDKELFEKIKPPKEGYGYRLVKKTHGYWLFSRTL
jgi:hypothetical protein